MSQEEPTRFPVHEAEIERPLPSVLDDFREVRPGFCPRCDAAAPSGARFCPSCQCYLDAPDVGRLASARRRLVATFLDSTFRDGGLFGPLLLPWILHSGLGMTVVRVVSTGYGVYTLYQWSRGTTPAKHMLRMTVVTEDGEPAGFFRTAFRETIGKWFSMMVLGLGVLAIPFDKEKQGWHDKFFGTWVVYDDDV